MQTLLLSAQEAATPALAAELIRRGELVAIPTETVYGLGANGLWVPFHQSGLNLAASWLDFMDFISEGIAMPLGALIMSLLVGWKIGPASIQEEVRLGDSQFDGALYRFYRICIRFVAPIGMAFIDSWPPSSPPRAELHKENIKGRES